MYVMPVGYIDNHDHMWLYMVMTKVKIAVLKAKLSNYLHRVRQGEQIIVTDRKTPVARIVPYILESDRLTIAGAKRPPNILKGIRIPPAPSGTDSLKALKEDRRDDLEI